MRLIFSAIFLIVVAAPTVNLIRTSTVVEQKVNAEMKKLSLVRILIQLVRESDSHRLYSFPLLHAAGTLRLNNGQPHKKELSGKILESSTPITSISLDQSRRLYLTKIFEESENMLSAEFCGTTRVRVSERYLFISSAGESFGKLELLSPGSKRCINARATPVVTVGGETISFRFIRAAVPVKTHHTLYLDRSGTLRLLNHLGKRSEENQSIAENIAGISFKKFTSRLGQYQLALIANFPESRVFSYSFSSRLLRGRTHNLLLRRR